MEEREVEVLFMQNMLSIVSDITDTFAQTGKPLTKKWIDILDFIFKEIDFDLEGFADGNDCGNCSTWIEYIEQLRFNMYKGERIRYDRELKTSFLIPVYDWLTGEIIKEERN